MKRNSALILCFGIFCVLAFTACKTLTGPPTGFEQRYYDIKTNTIEMVNWYTNTVTITNFEKVVVQETVPGTTNYVTITNVVPVMAFQTNVVSLTNVTEQYTFTPNEKAKTEIIGTATDIGGYIGAGNIFGLIAGGIVGLWGVIRSKKSQTVAATLAQVIEVGSELIKANPATAKLDAQWKQWMQNHQAETGTLKQVLEILKTNTDNQDARKVADALIKLTT